MLITVIFKTFSLMTLTKILLLFLVSHTMCNWWGQQSSSTQTVYRYKSMYFNITYNNVYIYGLKSRANYLKHYYTY